jgi:hypothetical protein
MVKWGVSKVLPLRLSVKPGFHGTEVYAVDSVSTGRFLLRGASKTIKAIRDVDIVKTQRAESSDQLCLQQSSGNSARPEIDVRASIFGKLHVQGNVGDLDAAARFHYSFDLAQCEILFGNQVQHAV